MIKRNECCDKCKWWDKELDKGIGECKIKAPAFNPIAMQFAYKQLSEDEQRETSYLFFCEANWPRTTEDNWCGKFTPKDEVDTENIPDTPDLMKLVQAADPEAIRQRLDELNGEEAALRTLLRSVQARERARQTKDKKGCLHEPHPDQQ